MGQFLTSKAHKVGARNHGDIGQGKYQEMVIVKCVYTWSATVDSRGYVDNLTSHDKGCRHKWP